MTQACFTAGFADGAHAGAALYEGWCTGEDHRFTDLLSTWTQCRRTKQKGIRKPSGEDMKKTINRTGVIHVPYICTLYVHT